MARHHVHSAYTYLTCLFVVMAVNILCCLCNPTITKVDYGSKAELSTLKLVQMIFRHGDRSPISIFPGDENVPNLEAAKKVWPRGFGQLSDKGMEQGYELGHFLRARYDGHINKVYNLKELYVRSSDVDRSVLTVGNMLAGLYPDDPKAAPWNKSELWRPVEVPVHTVPRDQDYIVHFGGNCPRYNDLYKAHYKDSAERRATLQNLIDTAWNKSGYTESFLKEKDTDKWNVANGVRDTLVCESHHGMAPPTWASSGWLEDMRTKYFTIQYSILYEPEEQAKLRGGALLQQMVDNMEKVQKNKGGRKMFAYSGHDTSVGAFLFALRAFNNLAVPYTTTVILEMHTSDTYNHTVQVLLRNSSQDLYQLQIPGCEAKCPYDRFLELTENVRPTNLADIESVCNSFSMGPVNVPLLFGLDRAMTIIILAVSVGVLILVTLICLIRCISGCCKRRRLRNRRKHRNLTSIPETVKLVSSGLSDSEEEFR